MKKTAIITFHASHNYGSQLQAYALSNTVKALGCECEIINFRTKRQKELGAVITKRKGLRYVLKNISHILYYKALKKKYNKFEKFIKNDLIKTKTEYSQLSELFDEQFDYEYYISGSDQIWNPAPADFDWAYFLPFVRNGKKIAYAPSFGQLSYCGNEETEKKMTQYLENYDYIAVREEGSRENVERLIGKSVDIVLDPTLLLEKKKWDELVSSEELVKGDYIFLYTLFATPQIIEIAKRFSKALNLDVVISNFTNQYDVISPFKKKFDSGPKEMLWLVKNAKLILASSFHGTVFSVIFNKPFYAIDGNKDARIKTLLNLTGLNDRSVDIETIDEKIVKAFNIDFKNANIRLEEEKEKSIDYLRKTLDL